MVKPQTPQRTTWFPPKDYRDQKKVNHRRDSSALCIVGRAHLEQERSTCPIDFALVLKPNRNSIGATSFRKYHRPWTDQRRRNIGEIETQRYDSVSS